MAWHDAPISAHPTVKHLTELDLNCSLSQLRTRRAKEMLGVSSTQSKKSATNKSRFVAGILSAQMAGRLLLDKSPKID